MMIARWSIEARFGHKPKVVEMMQGWLRDIAPQVGIDPGKTRLLTGSIGALEATLQTEHLIEDLTELDQVWRKLGDIPAHRQWSRDLEPYVVSGSSRWEIYRVL